MLLFPSALTMKNPKSPCRPAGRPRGEADRWGMWVCSLFYPAIGAAPRAEGVSPLDFGFAGSARGFGGVFRWVVATRAWCFCASEVTLQPKAPNHARRGPVFGSSGSGNALLLVAFSSSLDRLDWRRSFCRVLFSDDRCMCHVCASLCVLPNLLALPTGQRQVAATLHPIH